jgi:hypothetical protein
LADAEAGSVGDRPASTSGPSCCAEGVAGHSILHVGPDFSCTALVSENWRTPRPEGGHGPAPAPTPMRWCQRARVAGKKLGGTSRKSSHCPRSEAVTTEQTRPASTPRLDRVVVDGSPVMQRRRLPSSSSHDVALFQASRCRDHHVAKGGWQPQRAAPPLRQRDAVARDGRRRVEGKMEPTLRLARVARGRRNGRSNAL